MKISATVEPQSYPELGKILEVFVLVLVLVHILKHHVTFKNESE